MERSCSLLEGGTVSAPRTRGRRAPSRVCGMSLGRRRPRPLLRWAAPWQVSHFSTSATDRGTSAVSSGSTPPSSTSHDSPISRSTRCSTGGRSPRGSPPPTPAATSSRSARTGGNRRELALAHNGNLINAVELHAQLREREVAFSSTSDSEIIAALLATHPSDDIEDAIADVIPRLHGAFSTVVMTKKRVYAFRDPAGVRPLVLGMIGDRYCVASETCAFDIIGARRLRDVAPGELISIGEDGIRTR